jgi:predicted nucleic acid-binding protein
MTFLLDTNACIRFLNDANFPRERSVNAETAGHRALLRRQGRML